MLKAHDKQKTNKLAWETQRSEGPFYCPSEDCAKEVILKKGLVKAHHFAHKAPVTCIYGQGESEAHHVAKTEIYKALLRHSLCGKVDMEHQLDEVRPDIIFSVGEQTIAVEFQKSTLSLKIIETRIKRYFDYGIGLIWINVNDLLEKTESVDTEEGPARIIRPNEWQKYMHAHQFGRLYYWYEGALVIPVHLAPYKKYIPRGNWVEENYAELEGTNWFNEEVEYADYGGYHKTSKTKRTVITPRPPPGKQTNHLHIVEDFHLTTRSAFSGPKWTIPNSIVWIDNLTRWWQS